MPTTQPIPLSIDSPGSHTLDCEDCTFPFAILRTAPGGERVKLTIEARCEWDGSRYYGLMPEQTKLPGGWLVEADAVVMLTPAEQHAINCSDEYRDWQRECLEHDEEVRLEAAQRTHAFIGEARSLGLLRR